MYAGVTLEHSVAGRDVLDLIPLKKMSSLFVRRSDIVVLKVYSGDVVCKCRDSRDVRVTKGAFRVGSNMSSDLVP